MANGNGETIRSWWPIITVACACAVAWGSMQSQVQVLADEVGGLKAENSRHNEKESTDTVKVEVLATKQAAILEDVKEIKEVQKEQSKKLDAILRKLDQE